MFLRLSLPSSIPSLYYSHSGPSTVWTASPPVLLGGLQIRDSPSQPGRLHIQGHSGWQEGNCIIQCQVVKSMLWQRQVGFPTSASVQEVSWADEEVPVPFTSILFLHTPPSHVVSSWDISLYTIYNSHLPRIYIPRLYNSHLPRLYIPRLYNIIYIYTTQLFY